LAAGFLFFVAAEARRDQDVEQAALVAMEGSVANYSAGAEVEPLTMAILGGVAALGSIGAIGKTVHGLIKNKHAILAAKGLIEKFADLSTQGCSMLAKVGDMLLAELHDLNRLRSNNELLRACNNHDSFMAYFQLLQRELQLEATYLKGNIQEQFSAVYVQGFNMTVSKVCNMGNEALQQKQKERIVNRLWRMDGLMQGVCGERMPALTKMNSLLQSNSNAQVSTGELFTVLGLAFTGIAFLDMSVDVADSTINYMWGSSTKMLSSFLEKQLEQMTAVLCSQSRTMWEESALTLHAGKAVKRANFEMELFQEALVPFSMIPDFLHKAQLESARSHAHNWGLEKDSFWLCQLQKRCLQRFDNKFLNSQMREAAQAGFEHPQQCFRSQMVSVCMQHELEIDLAVPSSCFATLFASTSLRQSKMLKLGSNGQKVDWNFWVVQFYPSNVDDPDFNSKPNIPQCDAKMDELIRLQQDLDIDLGNTVQALKLDSYCQA